MFVKVSGTSETSSLGISEANDLSFCMPTEPWTDASVTLQKLLAPSQTVVDEQTYEDAIGLGTIENGSSKERTRGSARWVTWSTQASHGTVVGVRTAYQVLASHYRQAFYSSPKLYVAARDTRHGQRPRPIAFFADHRELASGDYIGRWQGTWFIHLINFDFSHHLARNDGIDSATPCRISNIK